ncbi:MAG: peptidase C69 [Acidobacteria bacterium]|nr:MAG: peptidase C69 [Acidobacteriota bacterium]
MSLLSSNEAEAILKKVLSFSKADELEATLQGGRAAYTRFGMNSASSSGDTENLSLAINAHFGQRSGIATTNTLDDQSLEKTVRAAEEIAHLRPEDPEQMPFLPKQQYETIAASFDEATYNADAETRARAVAATIDPARAKNLTAAGIFDHTGGFVARANTVGNFGYHRSTNTSYTTTVRSADELGKTGSGWATSISHRIADIDAKAVGARAIEKAELSREPVQIEPGNYTVILEPNAVGDLLAPMMNLFAARAADEGRSFLSKKGGGNRIGEKLYGDEINIYTDPNLAASPGAPFDAQGLPTRRIDFVRAGVVQNLNYARFWAKKMSKEPTPFPSNIVMDGGKTSIEDMIKTTERGILVTRFWYIRFVDAQTVLLTGLTRDGTFLIEQGRLKYAIKNFRFNETPVKMLNNIEAMSPVARIIGSERAGANLPILAPALRVRDFSFTSLSDAV